MMKRLHFLYLFLIIGGLMGYSQESTDLPDVWDFGATQLDESQYDNQLSVEVINSWYDASVTTGSSGNTLPDFTVGDLSFTGGGNDRLRTSNTALTRYDENIDEYEDFKGRVYINSSGATGRFFSIDLEENDKVTIWALTQNGTGNIHFEYVADPSLQNEVVAVGEELTELSFVAQTAGTYRIYDDTDKPSYFRIMRESNAGSTGTDDGEDVWDFGATQLDESQYNNKLSVEVINSFYDASITPGSSGNTMPDFTAGDLSFTGGGNDRLRTSNTALTRYDENIDEYEEFKGRIYINSSGATDRYFSLELEEDDEVAVWALTQNGTGNIHFEYVADPDLQNDVVAVGENLTELNFTAKAAGTYHIYDDTDKPSYFRITRKAAIYSSISGNVDLTAAAGISDDFNIVFTNEAGKTWVSSVSEGTYSVDLPAGYQYDVSLAGADDYSIAGSSTVEVTESTSSFDISIQEDGGSTGSGLIDVWDFGATQLDESQYNNHLSVEVINSWYDASVTPGSSGNTLPDFTVGDLSFTGGGSDRLRTTNTALTRYDENIDEYEDFKGRVYINSSGATGRFFSIDLEENDKVTIWALTQNGTGNIHFEYVADPSLQNEVVAVGEELTELSFVAQAAGTYRIYDDTDKPSYFRITRESDSGSAGSGVAEDVWDFGATQLDDSEYENQLSVEDINSWYDASITPGTSGHTLPDFTAGDLSFTGSGNDRLRTSNTALTRYDENIDEYEEFKGRIYINSSGATDRYFSLELEEDDAVTVWALTQNGNGNIHFEYVADPDQQNDVISVGEELTELNFVTKSAGTYHIYDDTDKPSYFRIQRKAATYAAVSGNIDITDADGIPSDFNVVFTSENGKTWSAPVSGGAYSVSLPVGYEYDLSLEGADGYSIARGGSLEVSESSVTNNITILKDGISIEGLADVWDFGAAQLDASMYNNKLTVAIINSWYDESITPGSSGNVLPDFTAGDLSWTGGGNDRLRTVNMDLTRYDDNINDYEDFKGRIYVNSRGATDRYFSIELNEDDKVTLWASGQDGNGEIHFEYAADPELQNDVIETSGEIKELNFVAKASGTYHIYDGVDKPSYFRIVRQPASYVSLSGNVDITEASGIPEDYAIVFSIEQGKTWNVTPTDGSYSLELPIGFEYSLSLEGADEYVISNGTSLSLTESTTTRDITIEKVELYTVTGSILGLDDKISELNLEFTSNAVEAVYVPEAIVDTEAGTYTVRLEPNINYTISGGVDGYYIPDDQIEIAGETSQDVVFEAVPDGPFGDLDEDGILNADDNCVYTPNADQADSDENGIGDVCEDDDGDGVINFDDNCPDTPEGVVVDVFGCEVFDLAANNYSIIANEVSCNGSGDGSISITAADTNYTYNVLVSGPSEASAGLSSSNAFSTDIEGLDAGTYDVCITVDGREDYEQCFRVTIEGPTPLAAYSSVDYGNNTVAFTLSGGDEYTIEHNGKISTTTQSRIVLDLEKGKNKISIKGDSECQGTVYKEVLLSEEVVVFPNPTQGDLKVYINGEDRNIDVSLHGFNGQTYISKDMEVPEDRVIRLDLTNYRNGIYFLTLKSANVSKSIKVIKS